MPIYQFGSQVLKERFLSLAIRGEKVRPFGLTEPDVGSDASAIKTGEIKGRDHYVSFLRKNASQKIFT